MKRFISIFLLMFFAVAAMAQERRVTKYIGDDTRWDYIGTAADTLIETNQDTIDFRVEYRGQEAVEKVDVYFQLDTLAGNDSIYVYLYGYKDVLGDTTTLISRTGALIDGLNVAKEISVYQTISADTVESAIIHTPVDLSFRYYLIRCIQDDNNSYDGGAKFDYLRFKLYKK